MYSQEDVKKVQARLLKMALVIRDILEKHQIPYFITYGTLLGAVRHKGFIPWDDDFDLYLFDDSYDNAMIVLKRELPNDMFLEYWDSEPKYFHSWAHVKDINSRTDCEMYPHDGFYAHQGISIDLYRIKKIPFSEVDNYRIDENIKYLERRRENDLIKADVCAQKKQLLFDKKEHITRTDDNHLVFATVLPVLKTIEINDILPLKVYLFEGYNFYGPNNADSFLTQRYGDYMTLPPKEDQKPHYSKVCFIDNTNNAN